MSLALMAEIIKQVRKTNRGREDEPSIFEFTSTHPGGETLIPGLCNFRRLLGSTPWDIFITVFPPCERWGRIPFVTTASRTPICYMVLDIWEYNWSIVDIIYSSHVSVRIETVVDIEYHCMFRRGTCVHTLPILSHTVGELSVKEINDM